MYKLGGHIIEKASRASDWLCENSWQAVVLLIVWETVRWIV